MFSGGRTHMFGHFRRLIQKARYALDHKIPLDIVSDPGFMPDARRLDRRQFIQLCSAAATLPFVPVAWGKTTSKQQARIAIIGAGIAGLTAAYTLKKMGISATLYEASPRTGGRIFSRSDLLSPGVVTELGAEFIDSNHHDMLKLARELNLKLIDRQGSRQGKSLKTAYFFSGQHYSELQVLHALQPLLKQVIADDNSIADFVDYQQPGNAANFDNTNLAEYLDKLGIQGWLRTFINSAYITEYGLDLHEQSALNFIFLLLDNRSPDQIDIFGGSDERYKILGGNQLIINKLTKRLHHHIELEKMLVAVKKHHNGYRLTFDSASNKVHEVDADIVIFTLPFNLLREVDLELELPPLKKRAIDELGYGLNIKYFLGTTSRPWQKLGYSGEAFSDGPLQLAWDHSQGQAGQHGGITCFFGGSQALGLMQQDPAQPLLSLQQAYDRCFNGTQATFNGKSSHFYWPNYRFAKGSYSCYKPGQWTSFYGAEIKPIERLFFAGEHCSMKYQGMMNGAVNTGKRAAINVAKALRLTVKKS